MKTCNNWNLFDDLTYRVFCYLNSDTFVNLISKKIGIKLFIDPGLHGGGWHIHSNKGNLNPHLRDVADFQHKLWDQLFIMSEFKLDVDSPFPKPEKELLEEKPEKLNYPQNYPKYRFYGNNIKKMIDIAVSWDQGELKDKLIYVIANHMKKCFLTWNKDTVDDKVIFDHIFELSDGKIKLDRDSKPLTDSKDLIIMSNKRFSKSPKKGKKSYRNYKRK